MARSTTLDRSQPVYLYYFGDRDPSGVMIDRKIEQDLRTLAPTAEIHFERVAVTAEQIATFNLPNRPTKTSDSRSRTFVGESVELDAIDPETLRGLVRGCIEGHIDPGAYRRLLAVEREEQVALAEIAQTWATGRDA